MADGSIVIDTKLDIKSAKSDIKELSQQIQDIQHDMDSLVDKFKETQKDIVIADESMEELVNQFKENDSEYQKLLSKQKELTSEVLKYKDAMTDATLETGKGSQSQADMVAQSRLFQKAQEDANAQLEQMGKNAEKTKAEWYEIANQIQVTKKEMEALVYNAVLYAQNQGKSKDEVREYVNEFKKNNMEYRLLGDKLKELRKKQEDLTNETRRTERANKNVLVVSQKLNASFSNVGKSISKGAKSLMKFGLALVGIRGVSNLIRSSISEWASSGNAEAKQLQANLSQLKQSIASGLLPVINAVLSVFYKILGVVNAIVKAFSGVDFLAKSTAKSTGATAKNAKGALASFDELNTLNKSDGGGAGDVAGNLGDLTAGYDDIVNGILEKLSSDFDLDPTIESINKLKDALEPLKDFVFKGLSDFYNDFLVPLGNWVLGTGLPGFIDGLTKMAKDIDWDKLNNALDTFWKALEPFAENVGEGLLWLWENVFVPFGTWTMNELVPKFLELLASALKVINSTIDAVKPLLKWLWESFLQPVASWTGGVIISVLNGISDALKGISDWINENQQLVETFTAVVGSFAAAWALVNTAITLWNVIGAVATGVTTALGAAVAFLTSPITLTIIAIGALIAIIVLLVRHWDEVKEAAINVWEKIKDTWNVVADWFSEHVVKPVKDFFGGLWNGIKEGGSKLVTFMQEHVIDPIVSAFKGFYNSVVGIMEGVINGFIGVINGFIRGVNKAVDVINNIPGVDLPGLREMGTVSIPRLAKGGIAYQPTQAIIGDAGREVVLPLDRNTEWLDELSDRLSQNQSVTVNFEGSLSQLARILNPVIKKEQKRVGAKLIGGVV